MFLPQGINLEKQLPLCVVAKPTVRAGHLPGISTVLGVGGAESFWEHGSSGGFVFHLRFTNVQNEDSSLLTSDLPGNLRWPNLRQYASEEKHIRGEDSGISCRNL